MQRYPRPGGLELADPAMVRSSSMSGPATGRTLVPPPQHVNPAPAYIAGSAASQIVASEFDSDGALVTASALTMVNAFLDQLLYNFLAKARSTQLHLLRPAVAETLKPRLAREAISGADEELKEYLGGGDDEELSAFHGGQEPRGEFDLDLAWKLARLRCMVYTRLGDMEEDQEDEYIEIEQLDEGGGAPRRFSNHIGNVTPAAAIFLTSVLEYLGEQALYYAGLAHERKLPKSGGPDLTALPERMTVDEIHMSQGCLESPLQRLWRTWRREVNSPSSPAGSISGSRRAFAGSRKSSIGTMDENYDREMAHRPSVAEILYEDDPADIGLPTLANDANEIQVPGLAPGEGNDEITERAPPPATDGRPRPQSMMYYPPPLVSPLTPTSPDSYSPDSSRRPSHTRHRSLPTPAQSPYASPPIEQPLEPAFATSLEAQDPLDVESQDLSRDREPTNGQREGENTPSEKEEAGSGGLVAKAASLGAIALSAAGLGAATSGPVKTAHDLPPPVSTGTPELSTEERDAVAQLSLPDGPPFSGPSATLMGSVKPRDGAAHGRAFGVPPIQSSTRGTDPEDLALSDDEPSLRYSQDRSVPRQETVPDIQDSKQFETAGTADRKAVASALLNRAGESEDAKPETGAPALTPLREMMEDAHDTSDEASSVTYSTDNHHSTTTSALLADRDRAGSGLSRRSESPSSKISHTKHSSTGEKLSQSGSQNLPGTERAAVQRVTPPPLSQRDPIAYRSQRSESFTSNRDKRPIHTSGSVTSTASTKRIPLPRSNSSEVGLGIANEGTDDKKRSLERLLQSDETIHYTLTPQNVREMEPPDSPHGASGQRPDTADLAEFFKNTAPPTEDVRPKTSRSLASVKGLNGLRSHPLQEVAKPGTSHGGRKTKSIDIQAVARPATVQSAHHSRSPSHGEPREAKVDTVNSMRDLADFAKSTGPDGPHQQPRSIQVTVDSAPRTMQAPMGPIPRSSPPKAASGPKRSNSRLQARDAAVRGDQSSALIDFIREGPPRDTTDPSGSHRIPRSVAPFRTTMDSDELQALGPAHRDKDAITRSSVASTQDSSVVAKSIQSSSNSQTGLLETTNRANARQNNGYTHQGAPKNNYSGTSRPADPMVPVRKQRRVRDPYAIDSEDEEEDEDVAPQPKRKAQSGEESLMDFLRNTSPPSESNAPKPLAVNRTAAVPAPSPKTMKRNSSATALKDLITRNGSVTASNKGTMPSGKTPPPSNGGVAQAFQGHPRAASPHLSRKGSPLDSYKPTQPTYAAHMDRNKSSGSKPKPANIQARTGGAGKSDTADLADFFKNSGPPPSAQTYTPTPTKEESGFSKYFSRKKKVAT